MKKFNETFGDSLYVKDAVATGSCVVLVIGDDLKDNKVLRAKI